MATLSLTGEVTLTRATGSSETEEQATEVMSLSQSVTNATQFDATRIVTVAAGITKAIDLAEFNSATVLIIRPTATLTNFTINVNGLGSIPMSTFFALIGTTITSLLVTNAGSATATLEVILAKT